MAVFLAAPEQVNFRLQEKAADLNQRRELLNTGASYFLIIELCVTVEHAIDARATPFLKN
jgi:hypothetical protein